MLSLLQLLCKFPPIYAVKIVLDIKGSLALDGNFDTLREITFIRCKMQLCQKQVNALIKINRCRSTLCFDTAFGVPGHLRLSMCVDDATVDGALAAFRSVCAT